MSAIKVPAIFTAIDKFSSPLEKMTNATRNFGLEAEKSVARIERRFRKVNQVSGELSRGFFFGGLAIAAPLIVAGKHAVEFEDKMADVAKTTGLSGKELKNLGQGILNLSTETRTSIDQLQDIAFIGGQMGVVNDEMESFIKTADRFNVALGDDFEGGTKDAVSSVSKLQSLFKQTRELDISASITKAGSVINALSATGKSTSQNINEFMLRVGALPDALKPSIQSTAALGAVLEESAIDAEVGARSFGILMTTAGKDLDKFSAQMNITKNEAAEMIKQDPSVFAAKFAETFKGLTAQQVSTRLKNLGIGATGVIKVVGALAANTERLTSLQKISNSEFEKGTSLLDEFNTKNETMAAKLAKAQNNFKAISILIGTELIPIMSELLKEFLPFIKATASWIKNNPQTVRTIVKTSVALGVLMFALSGLAKFVSIASFVMANFGVITAIATSPITLTVLAILALIAAVAIIIKKYDEWGAAALVLLGPFGHLISLVQEFRRNWDNITNAFSSGGILSGIKEIARTLASSILNPLQQIFELLSKISFLGIGTVASGQVKMIDSIKDKLGIETPAINPKQAEQEALTQKIEETKTSNATLTVKAPKGTVDINQDEGFFPKITETVTGFFN